MDRVAIYCRLSDEDRDKFSEFDESESIQNQKSLLTKYAMEQGWNIYNIYSDDDYSGLDDKRPAFNQMIQDAEKGKFNIVLCKHQSRFTRDVEVVERYLHRKFPEWGIRFVSITDHVDTKDKSNKKARQINSLVNEWYCEDISEAVRATFRVKREDGRFIGSFAPYGYMKHEMDKNRLVIDPEAATIVRMIFKWYMEGYGTQQIASMLNERNILNPTRYKQDKGLKYKNPFMTDMHGLWNKTTIRRILRDATYIGHVIQGKREKVNYKSEVILNKPRDEWVIVEDVHEPILDHSIFYAAQKRLNNNIRSTGDGRAHIFAGKVKCLDCKSTMNKVRSGRGHTYLRCKLYGIASQNRICTSHSILLDQLEAMIAEKIKEHFSRLSFDRLVSRLKQETLLEKQAKRSAKLHTGIKKQISEIDLIIKSIYADKVKHKLAEDQFNDLIHKFLEEQKGLVEHKENIEKEIENCKKRLENTEYWAGIIEKYKNPERLNHAMVNGLIDYIEIGEKDDNKERKIIIHWLF
ncbi:Site-specific DNA recombinase [Geosporobacter subterraneus DSM 17957]|uniref:Site-specific DNA recombinase n=1 Tax=Geosporobacter subterraneus DSM 17957 TaxID=1121919 RepID=A0A1M6Q1H8_9FIRM|nr:recombinase family protein [Geosporobacter subterraneus]SHK14105.1 Site-specific DNA recombinase [Geosporobacter subterraneus DSM 17957]